MQYHIITVGSELTLGLSVNTNAPFIAKRLGEEGYSCTRQISVPDDIELIAQAIQDSINDADAVLITGGLGPTSDDVTREAIRDATHRALEYKPELAKIIEDRFGARAHSLPQVTFRQAYLPNGAEPIIPTIGSAPGIILQYLGKYIVAMPGVPREMKGMLEHNVIPLFKQAYKKEGYYKIRVLKTTVRSEGVLQEAINDIIDSLQNVTVGIIASPGEIQLQLVAKGEEAGVAEAAVEAAQARFIERLGHQIFGFDGQTMEEVVGDLLRQHGLTVALAESATGGLISKMITDVPGSSDYFLGGIVSYSNSVKESLLDVSNQTLLDHGAVSADTALEMATGARENLNADIGLSVTGIAGPDGGTSDKPVGLTYIGLASEKGTSYARFVFFGSRNIVRLKSSYAALDMLRRFILDNFRQDGEDAS